MNGTKFELDEQKAGKLSSMSVNEVWDFVNKIAIKTDLIVVKNGEYHAKGTEHDLGDIGVFMVLEMVFTKSVKSWIEFGDDMEEDFIEISKELNEDVWE